MRIKFGTIWTPNLFVKKDRIKTEIINPKEPHNLIWLYLLYDEPKVFIVTASNCGSDAFQKKLKKKISATILKKFSTIGASEKIIRQKKVPNWITLCLKPVLSAIQPHIFGAIILVPIITPVIIPISYAEKFL